MATTTAKATKSRALTKTKVSRRFIIDPEDMTTIIDLDSNENAKESAKERLFRAEQFNNIMSNVKPLMTTGTGKEQRVITATATVPLSCCFTDERYQGLRRHKNVSKLIRNWDVRKLEPITLVPHPEECRFAIVNGKGRSMAAKEKKIDMLPAIILMDAPEDLDERLKFEAELFISQDNEVENVKHLEKHPARVIIGDEAAISIEKLTKKYNIRVVNKQGSRNGGVLGSYYETYNIASKQGEKCLDFMFSIIQNAGWDKQPNGYCIYVMRAFKGCWEAYPDYRKQIHRCLSKELRKIDPSLFIARAKSTYSNRDNCIACLLYMEDIICRGLDISRKIYIMGKRQVEIMD